MVRFLSIILVGLFCEFVILEPAILLAKNVSFSTISVEGNERLSDEAIVNYSRLKPGNNISSEELNDGYNKILNTGLFKDVRFKQ